MSKTKARKALTPQEIAERLADSLLETAKEDIESHADGAFIAKAFVYRPDGSMDVYFLPWKNQVEKEAMTEMLKIRVRQLHAPAFVLVVDTYYRAIEGGREKLDAWRRRFKQVRDDPERVECLCLFLHWTGGSTIRNYPYDRINGKVVWRELTEEEEEENRGRRGNLRSRFNPVEGLN